MNKINEIHLANRRRLISSLSFSDDLLSIARAFDTYNRGSIELIKKSFWSKRENLYENEIFQSIEENFSRFHTPIDKISFGDVLRFARYFENEVGIFVSLESILNSEELLAKFDFRHQEIVNDFIKIPIEVTKRPKPKNQYQICYFEQNQNVKAILSMSLNHEEKMELGANLYSEEDLIELCKGKGMMAFVYDFRFSKEDSILYVAGKEMKFKGLNSYSTLLAALFFDKNGTIKRNLEVGEIFYRKGKREFYNDDERKAFESNLKSAMRNINRRSNKIIGKDLLKYSNKKYGVNPEFLKG